ncbi:hypothetical protein Tco_0667761 [Tanacetum coccineum]
MMCVDKALTIFLDGLVTAWGAILISVTLILLFGEIIPKSVCTRYGLAIVYECGIMELAFNEDGPDSFMSIKLNKYNSTHRYVEGLNSGKIAAIFLEVPVAKVFLAQYCKSFIRVETFKVGDNVVEEEDGEWIRFLGGNSSSGTKKYRGSNSNDGGNTGDGVKIAGEVIGSSDSLPVFTAGVPVSLLALAIGSSVCLQGCSNIISQSVADGIQNNVVEEEDEEHIRFLGGNSSSGTKKYRGSNSNDGGITGDGVKIAGGVIGSSDEIVQPPSSPCHSVPQLAPEINMLKRVNTKVE